MSILVTGAGGAIGSAIAGLLIEHEHRVIAHDVSADSLAEIRETGAISVVGDLRDSGAINELAETCFESEVRHVVAAHGVDGSASLSDLEPDLVRRVIDVNACVVPTLFGLLRPQLAERKGSFVVVASQAGLKGEPDNAAYCASKFAVVGWVNAIGLEMERQGVAVRALCPGCTETPLLFAAQERFAAAQGLDADVFIERRRSGIPIERFARLEETAAAAIYLLERTEPRPRILAVTGGEVLW